MITAHDMVWRYGMGDKGFIGDYAIVPESQLSEKIKEQLNEDTGNIFTKCHKEVHDLLTREHILLDRFANELLAKEELDYDEIEAIFAEYGKKR